VHSLNEAEVTALASCLLVRPGPPTKGDSRHPLMACQVISRLMQIDPRVDLVGLLSIYPSSPITSSVILLAILVTARNKFRDRPIFSSACDSARRSKASLVRP
jgi:hypothetical protein